MRAFLGGVTLIGLVGLGLSGCGVGGAESGDQEVIDQLREAGADLSRPREVRYYLYLPDEGAARQVAATIDAGDRSVAVEPAAVGSDWLVLVTETVVVDLSTMESRAREFGDAVAPFEGEYDGWEAAVSP